MDSSDHRPATPLAILRVTLARDPVVRLCLALAAAAGLFIAFLSPAERSSFGALAVTATFLVPAIFSTRSCWRRVARPEERSFWHDLAIAYGLWLAIAVLLLASGPGAPYPVRLAAEIGTAVYYVLLVRAVESQPHRRRGAARLARRLNLAAVVVFVFGLLTYFWLIPGVLLRGGGEHMLLLPSVYLYATLDALLTVRLTLLARAVHSPRWRLLYSLLALTTGTMLAGDLAGSVLSYTHANYFYSASMIFVVLAARSRLRPPDAAALGTSSSFEDDPDRSWQTVVYALTLPLIDLAIYRFSLLDEAYHPLRATFVLLWTPLLAVIALLQNRQLSGERLHVLGKLRAKNEEMERFTHTVSHDLKAPLITIQGFLGMLERDTAAGDRERMESDIQRIRKAAEGMNRLIDELLELSRIGQVVNRAEAVSLRAVAAGVTDLLAAEIEGRGVDVTISADLPVVTGDRARLAQVFQNLVENAIKYMGQESDPRVEISFRRQGQETVYSVRDNGLGIDPRYREKVFELFSRLEPGVPGTGVGLALVKRIVESHGGRIWVESEGEGRGSTFCFTLADPGD